MLYNPVNSQLSQTTGQTHKSEDELQNIDQIGQYLNKYTLHFIKDEYEYEWKLMSMKEKKWITLIGLIFCIMQDIIWTTLLMETSLTGKIERGVMDLIMFLSYYKVFVKKEMALNFLSGQNPFQKDGKIAEIRKESC